MTASRIVNSAAVLLDFVLEKGSRLDGRMTMNRGAMSSIADTQGLVRDQATETPATTGRERGLFGRDCEVGSSDVSVTM